MVRIIRNVPIRDVTDSIKNVFIDRRQVSNVFGGCG